MRLFWWLILFFIGLFFIFSPGSVICKKYTNTDGKDRKHTNATDISPIWLYWRLFCRLYWRQFGRLYWRWFCRVYWRLFCRLFYRLYCRLFFVMQYFFFPLFHKCSKFMALSDTSWMFLSCYCFFLFLCHFLFNTKSTKIFISYVQTSIPWFP